MGSDVKVALRVGYDEFGRPHPDPRFDPTFPNGTAHFGYTVQPYLPEARPGVILSYGLTLSDLSVSSCLLGLHSLLWAVDPGDRVQDVPGTRIHMAAILPHLA